MIVIQMKRFVDRMRFELKYNNIINIFSQKFRSCK